MLVGVCRKNHLDDDLSNVPVLGFTQEFKDVVLGVEKKLEGDTAMMMFQN